MKKPFLRETFSLGFSFILAFLTIVNPAHANSGIALISDGLWIPFFEFVVVFVIEYLVFILLVRNVNKFLVLGAVAVANFVTTVLGFLLMLVINRHWSFGGFFAYKFLGLIPSFFLSVYIETKFVLFIVKNIERKRILRAVWIGNALSYIALTYILWVYIKRVI